MIRYLIAVLCLAATIHSSRAQPVDFANDRIAYAQAIGSIIERIERSKHVSFEGRPLALDFEQFPDGAGVRYLGIYDSGKEALALNARLAVCDPAPIVNPGSTYDRTGSYRYEGICSAARLEKLLAHEIGHHYMTILLKRYAPDGWLRALLRGRNLPMLSTARYFAIKMVAEGVAEYFAATLEPNEPLTPDWYDTEMSQDEALSRFIGYRDVGGLALVRPILDVHVERGVQCLVTNPLTLPTANGMIDFRAVIAYREKMIECARTP